ncbi:histidine kinase [Lacibacter cauensis]|uniref:Histidine kinase n=1 Tax=Lacibacter cauensis TaxID=510947 RepID=A0A562SFR0_9BACT|nr:histidine kinase [Lacibacter cauensis]TWI80128.1 histidine kinase [Lacibacter cauensis]
MRFLSKRKWLIHLVFWIVMYILYLVQPLVSGGEDAGAVTAISYAAAVKTLFHLLSVAATSYFICIIVMPLLLEKTKLLNGFLLLVSGLYAIAVVSRVGVVYLVEPLVGYNNSKETLLQIVSQLGILFQYYIIGNIAAAFPFVAFYLLLDRQLLMRKQAEAENEKKEAELAALKAQLNPHFLFNTLNNIYSLAVQNSPQTSYCIEKLAHILDYLLYRCNDKLVPMEKEIELLQNYLDLQKIRFGDRLNLKAEYKADHSYKIAPLLLLPIVENMFKHGVEQNAGKTDVKVSLECFKDRLTFNTENLYDPDAAEAPGIGLQNLKRQLELLYPEKNSFTITKANHFFKTNLQLTLS